MFEAIESTDWFAIPGYPKFYEPGVIAPALRALSRSTSAAQAAGAASALSAAGLTHDHSAMVHPAAVAAAPILLDIIEHANPAARSAAIRLLHEGMDYAPLYGFNTVDTGDGFQFPLCCAIARSIRARRPPLTDIGRLGKDLLAVADSHWRLNITEAVVLEESATLVVGTSEGCLPTEPGNADLRIGTETILLESVVGEYQGTDDGEAAMTIFVWVAADGIPPGSVLSSPCSDALH
ncbi:hypothetical protein [Catenulispora subtropica]|uniref:HEAT repeat domain-containing protein n=1 Tax=Catenulispora subtropica TaxID=450798 RepID=A0ABN2R1L1_9ACTN